MNRFQLDDLVGREKFKKEFQKHYIMQDTDEFNKVDIMLTACTTNKAYTTEIKNRKYEIDELKESTILEQSKLQHFKQLYRKNPDRCYTYFNYYCCGAWISFDLSNRIKFNLGLDNVGQRCLPSNTSDNGDYILKEVVYLKYCNDVYIQDKLHYSHHE